MFSAIFFYFAARLEAERAKAQALQEKKAALDARGLVCRCRVCLGTNAPVLPETRPVLPRRGPQVYFSSRRRLELLLLELRCAVAVADDNSSLGSKGLLLRGQARFSCRTDGLAYGDTLAHSTTPFGVSPQGLRPLALTP